MQSYPRLREEIERLTTEKIKMTEMNARDQIIEMVNMQLAYINTNNEDFQRYARWVLQELRIMPFNDNIVGTRNTWTVRKTNWEIKYAIFISCRTVSWLSSLVIMGKVK